MRSIGKELSITLLALVSGWILYIGYVQVYGYTYEKVERDLCRGKWMVFQETGEFASPLRCTGIPKTKPLPGHLKRYRVDSSLKFTLSDIDELCDPGTKPKDVAGILACVRYRKGSS